VTEPIYFEAQVEMVGLMSANAGGGGSSMNTANPARNLQMQLAAGAVTVGC
jgi:hypothetical protein